VNLHNTADSLLTDIEAMRPVYGDDWADDTIRSINSALSGIDAYTDQVKDDAAYWSRFEDESSYGAAMFDSGAESGEEFKRMLEEQTTPVKQPSPAYTDPSLPKAQQFGGMVTYTPYMMYNRQPADVKDFDSEAAESGMHETTFNHMMTVLQLEISEREQNSANLLATNLWAFNDNEAALNKLRKQQIKLVKANAGAYIGKYYDRMLVLAKKDTLTADENREAQLAAAALKKYAKDLYSFGSIYDKEKAGIANGCNVLAEILTDKSSPYKAMLYGALDSLPNLSAAYNDPEFKALMKTLNSFYISDSEVADLASQYNPFEDTKESYPGAYIFGNIVASLIQDAIPTGNFGLADEAVRGISGFAKSKLDDLVALLKKAFSATGKNGDDILKLAAKATGKSSDDILLELAKATGKNEDDIIKAFAEVANGGDDAARVLTGTAGDNVGDVATSQADNLDAWVDDWNTTNTNSTFDGMSGKPDEVPKAPDPEFNKPLEDVPPKGYNLASS
jgi:hypothetical protein